MLPHHSRRGLRNTHCCIGMRIVTESVWGFAATMTGPQVSKLLETDALADAGGITFSRFEDEFETAARLAGLPDNMPVPRPPFAIVSSNTYMEIKGKLEPVRVYSWGTCVITDFRYSDFAFLQ